MKYLGIDYGLKKVGLAISEGQLAAPLKVLTVSGLNDALNQVQQVIKREQINIVIIGMPDSGDSKKIAVRFGEELDKVITVTLVDENLSTNDAKQALLELGGSRKSRHRKEDAVAATIILQNYLNSLQ